MTDINMLDAERRSAICNDFEVINRKELKALYDRIEELELEVLKIKQAAANGAWCRRSHNEYPAHGSGEFLPPLPTTIC